MTSVPHAHGHSQRLTDPHVAYNEYPNPPWNTVRYEWDATYEPCTPEWFAQKAARNALVLGVNWSTEDTYAKYRTNEHVLSSERHSHRQETMTRPADVPVPATDGDTPMRYDRIGVLTDTHLYHFVSSKVAKVKVPAPVQHIGDIFSLCLQYNLVTIWVLGGTGVSDRATRTFIESDQVANVWEIRNPVYADGKRYDDNQDRCTFVRGWKKKEVRLPREKGVQVHVSFAEYNDRWQFDQVTNPVLLLGSLVYLEDALGTPAHYSPSHVGKQVMVQVNQGKREGWLTPVLFRDTPELKQHKVTGINWKRAITEDEQGKYRYLIADDKNSMYPSSCTSVLLGSGNPEHVTRPVFDVKKPLPGLYRCTVTGSSLFDGYQLPSPVHGNWYWTYTVKLLHELGYQVAIEEAYVWREYHTTLRPWAEKLWTARAALDSKNPHCNQERYHNQDARAVALRAIKPVMNTSLGLLDISEKQAYRDPDTGTNPLYRPDWYNLIKDHADYRLYWNMKKLHEQGVPIVGVNIDCLYYLATSPEHAPGVNDRANELGGFKPKFAPILLDQVVNLFAGRSDMADVNMKLNTIAKHRED